MARAHSGSVFLLTDYGQADEFAGVVRAVLARQAPGASLVDLTHDIAPFDIRAGALALARAVPHLGPGVVLAVVDPGVGTARRALAVECAAERGPRFFVGPDNGLLGFALDLVGGAAAAVSLSPASAEPGSATFDGRDVFAPAAASLWRGDRLDALGPRLPVEDLVALAPPLVSVHPGSVEAEVLWVDRFGNVQLAAPGTALPSGVEAVVVHAAAEARPARAVVGFGALRPGEVGVMVDANDRIAVVCNQRPAATVLGVRAGDTVKLEWQPGPSAP